MSESGLPCWERRRPKFAITGELLQAGARIRLIYAFLVRSMRSIKRMSELYSRIYFSINADVRGKLSQIESPSVAEKNTYSTQHLAA